MDSGFGSYTDYRDYKKWKERNHPVLPNGAEVSKRTLLWVRIAGIILILIGIFTRVHY